MVGVPRVVGARGNFRPRGLAAGLVGLVTAALVPFVITGLPADAALGPCDVGSNPIVCENSKPGSPSSQWMVDAAYGDIVGFGTESSVQAGDVLPFKVRTPSASWRIEIYRLGWYGGDGARLMANMAPSVALPQSQPPCLTDSSSGLVDCANWAVSASWSVPTDAVSGVYVANFFRSDGTFGVNQFPFVVRSESSRSDLVIQTSDQTWQAYNSFGGNSLYGGTFAGSSDGRAYKVSYNRPYLNSKLTNFQNDELAMVRWVERNGYDVSYLSSVDTSRNPALLLNHKVFISSGHDEYWNGPQRAGVEQARAAGVNLAFFSGNEMFWKTRFEPSIDGTSTAYRTMVCYKETKAGAKIDPSPVWTGTWRDPRLSPPADGGRPENAVTGTLFRVNGTRTDTITVPAQYAPMRLWRNTDIANLQPGQTASLTPSSLGHEWDEFADNGFRPPGAVAMSETTVTVSSGEYILKDHGNTYGTGTATHSLVLYRDQTSGALVFGAGTVQWAWGLDNLHLFPGPATDQRMQQATVNLLADMGAQPQTLQAGLVVASRSTDSTGPTPTITSPGPGASVPAGSSIVVTGTATDTGGQVAGIEVSVDGGSSWRMAEPGPDGRFTSWSYAWTPTAPGSATVRVRASDDSANIGAVATVGVTVTGRTCPCTLFGEATPSTVDSNDASPYELGVRFQTSVTSSVTGVRFYKAAANTGTHTGSLWSSSGQRLATGTFSAETASGWQTLTFPSPVPITAGTTYIASYTTTTGHYSFDAGYFTGGGAGQAPLTAPASTTAAPQAVFISGSGFPTSSFRDANYWVDVVVTTGSPDTAAPTVTARTPAVDASGVSRTGNVTATFNENVTGVSQSTMTLRATSTGAAFTAAVSYSASSRVATLDPTGTLPSSTQFTVDLTSGIADTAGNPLLPVMWKFTTAGDAIAPTVTGRTPAIDAVGVGRGTNVKATFSEPVTGVDNATMTLRNSSTGSLVTAVVTLNATGRTATLNPGATLPANTRFTVVLTSGITDVSGNPLAPTSDWSFTTRG